MTPRPWQRAVDTPLGPLRLGGATALEAPGVGVHVDEARVVVVLADANGSWEDAEWPGSRYVARTLPAQLAATDGRPDAEDAVFMGIAEALDARLDAWGAARAFGRMALRVAALQVSAEGARFSWIGDTGGAWVRGGVTLACAEGHFMPRLPRVTGRCFGDPRSDAPPERRTVGPLAAGDTLLLWSSVFERDRRFGPPPAHAGPVALTAHPGWARDPFEALLASIAGMRGDYALAALRVTGP